MHRTWKGKPRVYNKQLVTLLQLPLKGSSCDQLKRTGSYDNLKKRGTLRKVVLCCGTIMIETDIYRIAIILLVERLFMEPMRSAESVLRDSKVKNGNV